MAVRIRLKKMGRKHRPFFRLCAMDARAPRDGKVIEELGYYDPMVRDRDARALLKGDRIAYWLSVGAQPTENAAVLIKKYGLGGTHVEQQKAALERLAAQRRASIRLGDQILARAPGGVYSSTAAAAAPQDEPPPQEEPAS